MLNNRITLADLRTMPVGAIMSLPAAELLQLQEEALEVFEAATLIKEWVESTIRLKDEQAHAAKDTIQSNAGGQP